MNAWCLECCVHSDDQADAVMYRTATSWPVACLPTSHRAQAAIGLPYPQALRQPWSCWMLPRTMTMFRIDLITTDWMYTRRFSGMKAEYMIYFNTINGQLVSQKSLLEFLLLTIIRLRLSKSLKRRIQNRMWTQLIFRKVIHHFFFKNKLNFIRSEFYGHIF
jgi:hypothetical protein